jgi:FkbM family methyltransferase
MILDFLFCKLHYITQLHGVIHVGAHYGEEYGNYKIAGIKDILFFEPSASSFSILKNRMDQQHDDINVICVPIALGSTQTQATLHTETANQGQSSSLLVPKLHLEAHPTIQFTGTEQVNVNTLDTIMQYPQLAATKYNILVMDTQGYELEVLKGAIEYLANIDYVYTEVNFAELYEGCAQIDQLDEFLSNHGFKRVQMVKATDTWGDAFYVRETLLKKPIEN